MRKGLIIVLTVLQFLFPSSLIAMDKYNNYCMETKGTPIALQIEELWGETYWDADKAEKAKLYIDFRTNYSDLTDEQRDNIWKNDECCWKVTLDDNGFSRFEYSEEKPDGLYIEGRFYDSVGGSFLADLASVEYLSDNEYSDDMYFDVMVDENNKFYCNNDFEEYEWAYTNIATPHSAYVNAVVYGGRIEYKSLVLDGVTVPIEEH